MKKTIKLKKPKSNKIRLLKPWEIISNPSQNCFFQAQKVKCIQCQKELKHSQRFEKKKAKNNLKSPIFS